MNGYWKCDFENIEGKIEHRMIYAKTTASAFKHCFEVGIRFNLTPMYETLTEASENEIKELKENIKKKARKLVY